MVFETFELVSAIILKSLITVWPNDFDLNKPLQLDLESINKIWINLTYHGNWTYMALGFLWFPLCFLPVLVRDAIAFAVRFYFSNFLSVLDVGVVGGNFRGPDFPAEPAESGRWLCCSRRKTARGLVFAAPTKKLERFTNNMN